MKYQLISIDLQNDFTTENGLHYKVRPSIQFDKEVLFPFLKEKGIKIAEIVSDYRQPRPGDRDESCVPGTWGYESIVPREIVKSQWLKCMNSPIWVRENIGNPDKVAGLPFQDPKAFGEWLEKNIGDKEEVTPILFGLTLDCCVLSTLQELNWRGYYPKVLYEATDHYMATEEAKNKVIESAVTNWADVIYWDQLKKEICK
jgi:nicotinamidase-related amidase